MLALPLRWSRQPQRPGRLAAGVTAVHAAVGDIGYNSALLLPESIVGAVGAAGTAAGRGFDPTTTTGRRILCAAPGGSSWTIITRIVPVSLTGSQQILTLDSSSSPTVRQFQFGSNGTSLDFVRFNTAASAFSVSIASALQVGTPTTIVATSEGLSFALYAGNARASGTMTGTASSWTAGLVVQATWFERISAGSATAHGSHISLMRAVLPYALPPGLAADIAASTSPWDFIFAPRRIWVPQAAISGLPTLSLPTYVPGSLTATGFRPRVTAT